MPKRETGRAHNLLSLRYILSSTLKKIVISAWLGACVGSAKSQEIRVGLLEGITFGRSVDNYHYTADHYQGFIEGAWRHGLSVACYLDSAFDIGLVYYRLNTNVPTTFYSPAGTLDHEFKMNIQWVLVEFVAYLSRRFVRPFLGSDAGIGILTLKDPPTSYKSSRVKFTWGGNLGLDFSFRKLVTIRLKADLLYSIKIDYPAPPVTSNIMAYNSYLQSALSAGIIFRFKRH